MKPRIILILCLWGTIFTYSINCRAEAPATSSSNPEAGRIAVIVLPEKPEAAEQFAADLLARTIAEMTQSPPPPIVSEAQPKPAGQALLVGRTRDNLTAHHPDAWPGDTIYIGYGSGDIAIIGQGRQGTLFAAIEFLRDQGCRWYMPTQYGKVIPQRAALKLLSQHRRHTPSFYRRGWYPTPASEGVWKGYLYEWAVGNGLNALTNSGLIEYPPEYGYGTQCRDGHTLIALIPSADHPKTQESFAAHPEWYPLVNGKRVWHYTDGRPVQACTSNPEVIEEVARYVIDYFQQHPLCQRFSVSHNDEPSYWCECEACRALDGPQSTWVKNELYDAYGSRCKAGVGPMSNRYIVFINQVARKVAQACPGKYISFYAYGSTCAPPRHPDWRLESNVIVQYSHGCEECYRHSLFDPTCTTNAELVAWMGGWASKGHQIIYYDYPPMGPNANLPTCFTHSYKRYMQELRKIGATSMLGEDQGTWGGSGLYHYLKARLLWDMDTDVDQLVQEFCRDLYGSAADTMIQFYHDFENYLQQFPDHLVWGRWVAHCDKTALTKLNELLAQARQQAQTPPAQKNVLMMQAAMNSLILGQMMDDPAMQSNPEAFEDYRKLCAETVLMVKQLDEPFPLVVTPDWVDKLEGSYRPPFEALAGREILTLPLIWRFRTDPGDEGVKQNWFVKPDMESSAWNDIRVDASWTDQGFSYHGAAWYAVEFQIDQAVEGRLWLLFNMLDGAADIWLDGRSVGQLPADPWDKPKAVEISSSVQSGKKMRLVVRVVKNSFAAGITKPVVVTVSPPIIGDH